jgi:DUF971 family protein
MGRVGVPCENARVTTPSPRAAEPPPPAEASLPTALHADREAGTLSIDWADGHHTLYDAVTLRWLCPCAYCRGEAGMPGWLDSAPTLTAEQTRLVDLHLVGNYAVSPHWADGHGTGYYPFRLLRERCPCVTCTARRAGDPSDPARPPAAGTHQEHA